MRESRSYGSVRGVAGNRYPYRDPLFALLVSFRRGRRLWTGPGNHHRQHNR